MSSISVTDPGTAIPSSDPTEAEPPVVLCVDDEPAILSSLRRLLRPSGYKVLLAEGGQAGLAVLEKEPVDLVISDMRMPEMDGAQFLEQVRQRWPDAVRILLTGYADINATIAAINRGEIHRYIAKPWEDQDLQLSVSEGLRRRQLEAENRALVELTQLQNGQLQEANGQLQEVNGQLQNVNGQLQEANGKLENMNAELERRVAERTAELEASHARLEEAKARMEEANVQLNAANVQLEENFALSISVFAGLLELRDGSVAGHGHRVAKLARRIAEHMSIGPVEVLDIYNAGLLHEVGKIGLPDELMQKTVSLMSGSEFTLYKQHPVQAQAALMPLGRLRQTAVIIRSQHERVDGKGYPDGLSGYEVPLGSQIINIASTYESLIAGRLAEKVFSTDEALAAVREGAEHRYDAEVLAAFDQVMEELALERVEDQEVLAEGLRPGMVLARDLLSPHGSLLLPAGFAFSAPLVRQVQELAARDSVQLVFFVKKPGVRPGAKPGSPPAKVQHA